eukprot:scaffold36707_cov61-Attheya_sp.AAC.1
MVSTGWTIFNLSHLGLEHVRRKDICHGWVAYSNIGGVLLELNLGSVETCLDDRVVLNMYWCCWSNLSLIVYKSVWFLGSQSMMNLWVNLYRTAMAVPVDTFTLFIVPVAFLMEKEHWDAG